VLRTGDGREFDKARIIPYAYRRTYAQRHADAGVAPDLLRELMDHTVLIVTLERRCFLPMSTRCPGQGVSRMSLDRRREE
jgi:hypothetical protein